MRHQLFRKFRHVRFRPNHVPGETSDLGSLTGVSREATTALAGYRGGIGVEQLWEIYDRSDFRHTKFTVMSLVNMRSKWESLPFVLHSACGVDDLIRERAKDNLHARLGNFNRGYIRPTPEQLRSAADAIEKAMPMIGKRLADQLRFFLKGWQSSHCNSLRSTP